MQSLDVQVQKSSGGPDAAGIKGQPGVDFATKNGKKGAETARNGTSFLAIIEKMIAGSMEGMDERIQAASIRNTGRGAGNPLVPGEGDTLIKPGSDGIKTAGSKKKIPKGLVADSISAVSLEDPTAEALIQPDGVEALVVDAVQQKFDTLELELDDSEKSSDFSDEIVSSIAGQSIALAEKKDAAIPAVAIRKDEVEKDEPGDEKDEPKIRKADRHSRDLKISVRDERIQQEQIRERTEVPLAEKTLKDNGDGTADMSISFRSDNTAVPTGETTTSLYTDRAADGESFSAMLAKEVREGAQDFVKAGKIILRNNNTGTIRLTLHPETLGNVRISLELSSGKKISGKIVVSSKEAYDAFKDNLDGFSDAFVAGGFESAGFDLSWSGPDTSGFATHEGKNALSAPFYSESIPDVMSQEETADRLHSAYGESMYAVNFFA